MLQGPESTGVLYVSCVNVERRIRVRDRLTLVYGGQTSLRLFIGFPFLVILSIKEEEGIALNFTEHHLPV